MKNLKGFLLVVGLLFLALAPVMAQESEEVSQKVPMINMSGEVQLYEKQEIIRPLNGQEMEAYHNPGEEILIGKYKTIYERDSFWKYYPIKIYDKVIVFQDGKIKTIEKMKRVKGERLPLTPANLGIVAIIFMLIFNLARFPFLSEHLC